MGRKRRKNKKFYKVRPDLQRSLTIIGLLLLGIASFLSFFGLAGALGDFLDHYYSIAFGFGKYVVALVFILWGYFYYMVSRRRRRRELTFSHYLGGFLLIFNTSGLASFLFWISLENPELGTVINQISEYKGGGCVGFLSMAILASTIGNLLTGIILLTLLVIGIIFTFQISLSDLVKKTYILDWGWGAISWILVAVVNFFKSIGGFLSSFFAASKKKKSGDDEFMKSLDKMDEGKTEDIITDKVNLEEKDGEILNQVQDDSEEVINVPVFEANQNQNELEELKEENLAKAADIEVEEGDSLFSYQTEEILSYKHELSSELLEKKSTKPQGGDVKFKAEQIKKTLKNFGIKVEMKDVQVGPVVTQFSFKPAEGTKLSRITALHDDLALSLAAHPIRIEAPIPGKPYVGLEVPNKQSAIVRIKTLIDSKTFKERKNNMQMILGKDVAGDDWITDLAKMPHLLVAGQTGSGKSVCLNSIIVSLLYQNKPSDLRFIMIDPKRVELPLYNGIPHLLAPVITDTRKTLNAFKWAVSEMERRYDILSKFGKRNIASYNEIAKEKMPYIVFIVDELADIMVTAGKEVETYIVRLTQMSRAIGIHLVIATQRPSVNVITGLIKANVPARISFSVASNTDSRTILDKSGAEKLIGKGDMLFVDPKDNKPRRIQGVFVSEEEVKKIANSLKLQLELPVSYCEEIVSDNDSSGEGPGGITGRIGIDNNQHKDVLYSQAVDIVIQNKKASSSYLQRRLRIGFTRAARLIDIMEENGIVGPAQGSKPRTILIEPGSNGIIE